MDRELLRIALVSASTALVLFIGFVLLRRSIKPAPRLELASGNAILEYPWPIKLVGWLAAVGFPAFILTIAAIKRPGKAGDWYIIGAGTAFFAGMGALLLLEGNFGRLVVSEEGILSKSPWRRDRFFRWDDVESVYWALGAFGIRSRGGYKVTVSTSLCGMPYFANAIQSHLQPKVYSQVKYELSLLAAKWRA